MSVQVLFGLNLKRLRTGANLSQLELSNKTELAHNFINDIEKGRKWVSAKTIEKFANALKAEPFQFFIDPSKLDGKDKDVIRSYLIDITDNIIMMLNEFRASYLMDKLEEGKK